MNSTIQIEIKSNKFDDQPRIIQVNKYDFLKMLYFFQKNS